MRMPGLPIAPLPAQGQGGLVAVAVTIVLALVIGGSTLSGLSMIGAKRSLITKQSLQTYYTAQAGMQEAVATRMLPRSNYLNFAGTNEEFYTRSGKIYQDPNNTSKGLVGIYRYMVIGGDAAKQADGEHYDEASLTPSGMKRLLAQDTYPPDSPFIVISNGLTCKSRSTDSVTIVDQFNLSNPLQPMCNSRYQMDELTLVSQVRLGQETASGVTAFDKVDRVRAYKNRTKLPLPASAFVPGYGWTNKGTELSFDKMWAYNQISDPAPEHNPVRLERVVFYNFADKNNEIFLNQEITAANTNIATPIPSNAAIRLYFSGPIDYRSISPSMDKSLADCKPQPPTKPNQQDECHIRVVPNPPMTAANHAYSGNTNIPLFPGGTQVILLPPLTNTLSSGTPHQLEIDATEMRNYNNVHGLTDYTITFTTQ